MEEQTGAHIRKIGKTTFSIWVKPDENAKGSLEDKLKRMIQTDNLDNAKAEQLESLSNCMLYGKA